MELNELLAQAEIIKTETENRANTAERVGGLLEAIIEYLTGFMAVNRVVATYSELFGDSKDQQNTFVQDASEDPTVNAGWAIYKYIENDGNFVKIAEQESLDIDISNFVGQGLSYADNKINLGGAFNENVSLTGSGDFNINNTGAIDLGNDTGNLQLNAQGLKITDKRTSPNGIEYDADYATGYTDRSLVDKAYVDNLMGGGGPGTFAGLQGSPLDNPALADFLQARTLTLQFHSDLDTVSYGQLFRGRIQFVDVAAHFKIASYSFESRINQPGTIWGTRADLAELQNWVDTVQVLDGGTPTDNFLWEMRVVTTFANGESGEASMNINYKQV